MLQFFLFYLHCILLTWYQSTECSRVLPQAEAIFGQQHPLSCWSAPSPPCSLGPAPIPPHSSQHPLLVPHRQLSLLSPLQVGIPFCLLSLVSHLLYFSSCWSAALSPTFVPSTCYLGRHPPRFLGWQCLLPGRLSPSPALSSPPTVMEDMKAGPISASDMEVPIRNPTLSTFPVWWAILFLVGQAPITLT